MSGSRPATAKSVPQPATAAGEACAATVVKRCVCQLCFHEGSDAASFILSTAAVHQFLDERAIPTPFLFAYLLRLRKKMNSFYLCVNCDSWVRRRNQAAAANKPGGNTKSSSGPRDSTVAARSDVAADPAVASSARTTLLAVDRLILSVMLPGTYTPPEMRITQRLIATIRRGGGNNWLATICPPLVVQSLRDNEIRLESRKVLKSISIAAWKSGRQQAVLGNAAFAKNIRCAQHGI
jgi:hypothetical protein